MKRAPHALAICERCNSQFASEKDGKLADKDIQNQFDIHICKSVDSSQNALRIVRQATDVNC